MRLFYLYIFSLVLFSPISNYSQTSSKNNTFTIQGKITGRDTGSVILWYFDDNNKGVADTMQLNKGRFHFSGKVNRVCESLLWADPQNRIFDNPSMIRFLLEPGRISINCTKDHEAKGIIKGSKSQLEKKKWDLEKDSLLIAKDQAYQSVFSLVKISKTNNTPDLQYQIKQLAIQRDSIDKKIRDTDVWYIEQHPKSYLSAYLLSLHARKLPIDSIQKYYTMLTHEVKRSSVGHTVLTYIYPLTDDDEFRKKNPLVDLKFDERLSKTQTIYDISLIDTSKKVINLASFKKKYIVIDFWASWCKPCIANAPYWNQLIKEYNPDSIQFISVSLDTDFDKWKQSIVKHNLNGPHFVDLNGFASLVAIYCKVLWVPKYVVTDKNGRVINYDAPQPINETELKTLLDNLLSHKESTINK